MKITTISDDDIKRHLLVLVVQLHRFLYFNKNNPGIMNYELDLRSTACFNLSKLVLF